MRAERFAVWPKESPSWKRTGLACRPTCAGGSPAAARPSTIEGGTHAYAGVAEVEHHAVIQPFDGLAAVLHRVPLHRRGDRCCQAGRGAACHHWACHRVLVPKPAGKLERMRDLLFVVLMLPTLDRARPIGGVPRCDEGPDP
jgi:hypothetical protein